MPTFTPYDPRALELIRETLANRCPVCTEPVEPLEWAYYRKHEDC